MSCSPTGTFAFATAKCYLAPAECAPGMELGPIIDRIHEKRHAFTVPSVIETAIASCTP